MENILTEISKYKQLSEDEYTKFMRKQGAYKFGKVNELKYGSFDAGRALNINGIQEIPFSSMLAELPERYDMDYAPYGVSVTEPTKDHDFHPVLAIHPDNKHWQYTFFHEAGHIMMGHNAFFHIVYPEGYAEAEAEMFAYLATKKLGIMQSVAKVRAANLWMNIQAGQNAGYDFDSEWVKRVEGQVDKFLRDGGWNDSSQV